MKVLSDLVLAISLIRRINVSNETIDGRIPNESISTFDLFLSFPFFFCVKFVSRTIIPSSHSTSRRRWKMGR